jgi:predicted nucleic acid-binding protein
MATVQINLPDELVQKAASAGLLSAEAMEAMLREQLRRRAGEALQAMWQHGPQEELTPEIEQEIVEEVGKVRAELVVTGDRKHLLPIGSHQGIAIVTAREVIDRVDAKSKT